MIHWPENRPSTIDLVIVVALVCLSPVIALQCLCLWGLAHFQFFPIAWLAFAYFVATRCKIIDCTPGLRRHGAVALMLVSAFTAYETVILWSPWLAYLSGLLLVTAWGLLRFGSTPYTTVLAMTSLPWLSLPLPVGYDHKLIGFLQIQSSLAASSLLDCIGIVHLRAGNVIELSAKRLFVDEACSGADSLYALMAICLGVVVWFRFRFSVGLLCVMMVPFWTSCSNILRLVTIAMGLDWFAIDFSEGTPHTLLGAFVFLLAFAADFCLIQFIAGLLGPSKLLPRRCERLNTSAAIFGWGKKVAICLFLLHFVAIGSYASYALSSRTIHRLPRFDEAILASLGQKDTLPMQLENLQLKGFRTDQRNIDSAFGQHSLTWLYTQENSLVTISSDFPFRGFHALNVCYEGSGWEPIAPAQQFDLMQEASTNDGGPVHVREVEFRNTEGKFAYLLFSVLRFDGTSVKSSGDSSREIQRLEQTILEPVTYQIQLLVTSSERIEVENRNLMKQCFCAVVPTFRSKFRRLSNR